MKKSIVIILIILMGFSSLSFGEIPDELLNEYPLTKLEYYLLKVEMDIRDDITQSEGRPNNLKFMISLELIYWLSGTRIIYTEYTIDTTNYFKFESIEREVELTKLIDYTIIKLNRTIGKIDRNDLLIIFRGDGNVEIGRFDSGKLVIR